MNDTDAAVCSTCSVGLHDPDGAEEAMKVGLHPDDEEFYYEYEFLGLTYSYSKAGYWGRLAFASVMFGVFAVMFLLAGLATQALCIVVVMLGALGLSLMFLHSYRGSFK